MSVVFYNISLYRIRYLKLFLRKFLPMEIRDIKSHLSILTVLGHYHLQPNKNSLIKCPFHDDKDPSLKIYTTTNTFNCFGCGKASSVAFCVSRDRGFPF